MIRRNVIPTRWGWGRTPGCLLFAVVWSAQAWCATPDPGSFDAPIRFNVPSGLSSGSTAKAPALTGDQEPRLISGVHPQYPPAYATKVEGEIVVDFIVCPDGTVAKAHAIRSSDPRLTELAVAAVSKWFFSPGLKKGVAVFTHMQVPVVFQARKPKPGSDISVDTDPRATASSAHLAAGQSLLAKNEVPAAISEFDASIRLSPESAAGYLARALAYAHEDRHDEALDDYAQAALLDPANQGALDAYRKSLPDTPESRWASLRFQTFVVVWRTVYETYYDPTFGGVDWLAIREKYRLRLDSASNDPQLISLLQDMLAELRRTHFSIIPREAAVFNPSERVRIGTVGAEVAFIDGGVVVTEVKPGSAGATAGMRPGDQIAQVDGTAISTTLALLAKAGLSPTRSELYMTGFVEARFGSAVGSSVRLKLVGPGNDVKPREVTVICGPNDAQWSEPIGYFPSLPIRCEARRDSDGIAYLQFNIFVPPVMKKVRSLLRLLKPGDGLIIDLRGNGGGISVMASGICGWLCRDEFVLGSMHQREGVVSLDVYPQSSVFDGPVAILIDGRSASTSEILAAGLDEKHRARLFGEPSAGAALPSIFKSLPTGDLFQFAVADVTTPSGALLEGSGVAPDQVVLRSRTDLMNGRDPVVDAARAWINAQRRGPQEQRKVSP